MKQILAKRLVFNCIVCPSVSEGILKDMGEIIQCRTATKHGELQTLCIFLGVYCKYTRLGNMN